jgi:hypothetical protein
VTLSSIIFFASLSFRDLEKRLDELDEKIKKQKRKAELLGEYKHNLFGLLRTCVYIFCSNIFTSFQAKRKNKIMEVLPPETK